MQPFETDDYVAYRRNSDGTWVVGRVVRLEAPPHDDADAGPWYRLALEYDDADRVGHPVTLHHTRVLMRRRPSDGTFSSMYDYAAIARDADMLRAFNVLKARTDAAWEVWAEATPAEAAGNRLVWVPLDRELPPDEQFVLLRGPSGYSTTPEFVTLGRRDDTGRPPIDGKTRWLDPTNTSLSDNAWEPTHWAWVDLTPLAP
jgi:hypothetical protein